MSPLKFFGIIVAIAGAVIITVCLAYSASKPEVTIPPNSQLCHTDLDCSNGQFCGFKAGYTAAVCRN